ncbi:hypothetical protein GT347_24780 [Xylophilus rhododendri]|uniref:Uncharacterized protein n=1 Tax=Xylophilus rhododendri TaxID=2697032 RepID=A0A857JCK7_9BURK|nr:hypothetical protein [Xylophilus rhododendri]QHJ00922.1 hypothetical protein GT347_24780 [Xylophilus rhododendri]
MHSTHAATSRREAVTRPNPRGYYVGRIEAFHAVLDLVAPGQPRFGELDLHDKSPQDWESALYAVHRRLGSAISRLTMEQRETLRGAAMDLSRNPPTHTRVEDPRDPDYCLARSRAFREIIGALDIRQTAGWMM